MDNDSELAAPICPDCQLTLTPTAWSGFTVHLCMEGHGGWVDTDAFVNALEVVRSYQPADAIETSTRHSPRHPDVLMETFRYLGVVVDFCPISRGIWLDVHEIRPVFEHDSRFKATAEAAARRPIRLSSGSDGAGVPFAAQAAFEMVFYALIALLPKF